MPSACGKDNPWKLKNLRYSSTERNVVKVDGRVRQFSLGLRNPFWVSQFKS